MFRLDGEFIVNEHGKVFDVAGGNDREGANLIIYNKHGKVNQQFDVVYVDEWKGEPGKGELNEDYGLYVDRDFYVVSDLGEHRYLDIVDMKLAIKTRNGDRTQIWWFDQKTFCIRSRNSNHSWDILSGGKSD